MINASPSPDPVAETFVSEDPSWYKRAVFYEVLVRGFKDSNGDGTGDLRGLIEKLGYLEWLGVDCLWLLPLYESPLRDGGYDISDYMKILPDFGDLGGLRPVDRGRARARPAHHHRPGDEPHQRPASLVPGVPARPRGAVRRLLRLVGRTDRATPTHRSSSSAPRSPTGPTTRSASSTTGTASSTTSRTSTTTTRPCRRPCWRSCGSGSTSASTASGWTPCPTCSSGRAPRAPACRRRTRT